MILKASKEEGVLIKRHYAAFNDDGTLAELEGFEIKSRGELKLIKVIQAEVVDKFLHGTALDESYSVVASVADQWFDLLDNQGVDVSDGELLDFISESSTMSKSLLDYAEQKSCTVTTARRLADILRDAMVKDKGLMCRYMVARDPQTTPVSECAIPVAIFETEPEIRKVYIRKWCKASCDIAIRSIIDWSYYRQRLSSAIQKIITIPAAMQKIANPVPRVAHPIWLHKQVRDKDDKFCQRNIRDMFGLKNKSLNQTPTSHHFKDIELVGDLEDMANKENMPHLGPTPIVRNFESKKGSSRNKNCSQEPENIQKHHKVLSDVNESDLRHESIDKNVDYQGWLDQKKWKWKETLEKRKKLRVDDSLRHTDNMIGTFDKLPTSRGNIMERTRGEVCAFFKSHLSRRSS